MTKFPGISSASQGTFRNKNISFMIFFGFVFAVSAFLRFNLSNYNREANDPHIQVIRYIIKNDTLPDKSDCWECFQPKFFHYTAAQALTTAGLTRRQDEDAQKIFSQFMNFLAGIITLAVAWTFMGRFFKINAATRVLAFALLALNPQLTGINSQVTNDSFLIMFCALAIYFACSILNEPDFKVLLLLILFSLLAVSTKTNGWVTVIAISISLFVKSFSQKPRLMTPFVYAAFYIISIFIISLINPLTQYRHNFSKYGTFFVIPAEKLPPPPVSNETYIPFAGVTSIADGFFTFRIVELIEHPVADIWKPTDKSTHYNSLWTHVYASAHSVHFENWPPSWRSRSETVYSISRGIFLLALLPTILIMTGSAIEILSFLRGLLDGDSTGLKNMSFGLFALLMLGHLLFIAIYAFEYQLYTFFKAIFIFPGLLAFLVAFLKGSALVGVSSKNNRLLTMGMDGLMILLILLYTLDVTSLIIQLLPNQSGMDILLESLKHIWS